jgi:hypothetical protein
MSKTISNVEVFSNYIFHLIQIKIKNKQDVTSKIFRQSPGISFKISTFWGKKLLGHSVCYILAIFVASTRTRKHECKIENLTKNLKLR